MLKILQNYIFDANVVIALVQPQAQRAKEPSTGECGDVIQNLLENSFFRMKQETARTTSIFLGLLDKHSPHSRDMKDSLIAANAIDLGAKLVTAEQGFLRYLDVNIHPLHGRPLSGDDVAENSAGRNG